MYTLLRIVGIAAATLYVPITAAYPVMAYRALPVSELSPTIWLLWSLTLFGVLNFVPPRWLLRNERLRAFYVMTAVAATVVAGFGLIERVATAAYGLGLSSPYVLVLVSIFVGVVCGWTAGLIEYQRIQGEHARNEEPTDQ